MMRKGGFTVITLLLIAVIAVCTAGTVKGQETIQDKERELWYREQEEKLLADTRDYLNQEGFVNSGVTLTRVVDGKGGREYTFTIHHHLIDRMEEEARGALRTELVRLNQDFGEAGENCSLRYEFLIL
jgi:hypothetical protein